MPSKPETDWCNAQVMRLGEIFSTHKWRDDERAQFALLLARNSRDRDHAVAAMAWIVTPTEDARGRTALRRFAGLFTLREALTATGVHGRGIATYDARDAILREYPHDLLALEAVPGSTPCFFCCSGSRWDRWGVSPDDPLRLHEHPKRTALRSVWSRPDLIDRHGGPYPWILAFDWARGHTPSGDASPGWHPTRARMDPVQFDRLDAEYLRSDEATASIRGCSELVRTILTTERPNNVD